MAAMDTDAIRMARRTAGLTQAQLAERIGVSVDTIGRVERGSDTTLVKTLIGIARVTGVPVESLLISGEPRT